MHARCRQMVENARKGGAWRARLSAAAGNTQRQLCTLQLAHGSSSECACAARAVPCVCCAVVRRALCAVHCPRARARVSRGAPRRQMFAILYGKTAAGLYAKAAGQNAKARQLYNSSADTYYKANDAAAYDDWVRARNHW